MKVRTRKIWMKIVLKNLQNYFKNNTIKIWLNIYRKSIYINILCN